MRRGLVALAMAAITLAGCGGAAAPPPAFQPASPETPSPQTPPAAEEKKPAPLRGYPAPEITGKDVRTGDTVRLSDFRGKVVLVNLWATWCPPCREEMPELETLQTELGDRVKVLAVGGDAGESGEKLLAYANDQKLTFTILHDQGMALREYRTFALPTTFVVDQNGVIRDKVSGSMSLEQMRQVFAKAEEAGRQQP